MNPVPVTELTEVRCRGCRRMIGVATDVHNGVYCDDPTCVFFEPASPVADRDDVIVLLDKMGVDRETLATEFGITKQRISQIVQKVA